MTNLMNNIYENKSLRQILFLTLVTLVLAIISYFGSVLLGYHNNWIVLKWGLWVILVLMANFYYTCKRYNSLWVAATLLVALSADIFSQLD